jgi:repressor LexA
MTDTGLETPKDLTERQFKVLSFIENEIRDQGYPPTIREIGEHLGIRSTNGVNDHLKALLRKGYIERSNHKSRTLKVLRPTLAAIANPSNVIPLKSKSPMTGMPAVLGAKPSTSASNSNDDFASIPLLGRVAAGTPILAIENVEDHLPVPEWLLSSGGSQQQFALEVHGDSMIGDGIFDGDVVFVAQNNTARTGDLVVAMVDEEVTVKRYFPEGDRIRLQPSNPRLDPIFVSKSDHVPFAILGHITAVFGKFPRRPL